MFFKGRLFERLKKRVYNKKPITNKRGPNKIKQSGKDQSANEILDYFSDTENDMSNDEQRGNELPGAQKKPCKSEKHIVHKGTK